ncbi:Clavaminate synthase-like protein [Thozetella sp. PMI_491]|nr:Clavaminate synthase-like protein [Thozetella sp. PMI_491]
MAPHEVAWESDSESLWEANSYTPSTASIQALKRALRLNHPPGPAGAPSWVSPGPRAIDSHDRDEIADRSVLQLTLSDLLEIEEAVAYFNGTHLPLSRLQADCFPLPTLSARIRQRSLALPGEQPYFLVRGLKPQWYGKRTSVVIFLGIASHVGTKRAMAKGDATVLHHVTNIELPSEGPDQPYRGPANRSMAIPFHTDSGAILSLYTLSVPPAGGAFYLADIHDVVARIRATRPELLETLQNDWIMTDPGSSKGYEERPLLFTLPSDRLAVHVSRTRLCNGFRRRPSALPPLSVRQVQALDALHAVGQETARRFEFRSGDMLFFNNLRMMHARDAFVDGCEGQNTTRRYLLRLLLQDEQNDRWEVPPELDAMWDELYNHDDAEEIIPIHESLFSFKASH